MAAKELLAQLHEVAANPRKQLDKYLAEGKKVVAVTYYTPQEIVHSMGLVPMGVWGADMEINEAKRGGVFDSRNGTILKICSLIDVGEHAGSGIAISFTYGACNHRAV